MTGVIATHWGLPEQQAQQFAPALPADVAKSVHGVHAIAAELAELREENHQLRAQLAAKEASNG